MRFKRTSLYVSDVSLTNLSSHQQKSTLKDLEPSRIANYRYCPGGNEAQLLRRGSCTPGTRVRLLETIAQWANDQSAESETVYWLFGPAGSGKSTIAYTVAMQFDFTSTDLSSTTLGANFFCNRQFDETRDSKWVVRTIAYQLAAACPQFREALSRCSLDSVHWDTHAQLEKLLVQPWLTIQWGQGKIPTYLIIVDALDEITGQGGLNFLAELLDMINKHDLPGLKFFVTSRPDPDLTKHVNSFANKRVYRLEEVPHDEVQGDIRTYFITSLPHLTKKSDILTKLIVFADGLFILAATIIRHLTHHNVSLSEQKILLKKLFPTSHPSPASPRALTLLDELYCQVLSDAFPNADEAPDSFSLRLNILHTFLCCAKPVSPSVANRLASFEPVDADSSSDSEGSADEHPFPTIADHLLHRLHAVFYVGSGKVLMYHKSFSDFCFDQTRSGRFWCDRDNFEKRLAQSCFSIMKSDLRFNIADIQSSYVLDNQNSCLDGAIDRNISPILRYSCQHWSHHLSANEQTTLPLLNCLSDFLDLRVLFWIEAMNLLHLSGLCDLMLRSARGAVCKASMFPAKPLGSSNDRNY